MAINVQRYTVSSSTLIGQITPYFLRGRRVIKILCAICSPLDSINRLFQTWAKDTLIDAATTSQIIVLKWSLKSKLGKYFANADDEFQFGTDERSNYTTLYENQSEQLLNSDATQLYMPENAADNSLGSDISQVIIRDKGEIVSESNQILVVAPPHNLKISDSEYLKKIRQYIESALVYGVEYEIIISKE